MGHIIRRPFGESEEKRQAPLTTFIALMSVDPFMPKQDETT